MSLVPMVFSHWWEDLDRPHRLLDQHFGIGLHPDQLLNPHRLDAFSIRPERCPLIYHRPWADLLRKDNDGGYSTVKADKDKFEVVLDVQHFLPEEIDIKVVDKYVLISAKHEEKQDEHGWISRQFTRKYIIPEQCNIDQVSSKLSSDGVLTIVAPRKEQPKFENEKIIKIEHTGKPALKSKLEKKEAPKDDEQDKKKAPEKK